MRTITDQTKRILRIIAGFGLVIFGIIDLPLPGPGTLFIIAGLSILAVDFVWAHRLKTKMKDTAAKAVDKVRGKREPVDAGSPKP